MEARKTYGLFSNVDRVKTIHIFCRIDGLDDGLFVDVRRQRELDDETVDSGVVVEPDNGIHQFGWVQRIIRSALETNKRRAEPTFRAGLDLAGHICFATTVMANENGREVRGPMSLRDHLRDFSCNFALNVGSGLFTVDELHFLKIG